MFPIVFKVSKIVDNLTNESKQSVQVQSSYTFTNTDINMNSVVLTLVHPVYDEIQLIDNNIPFNYINNYPIVDEEKYPPSWIISLEYHLEDDEFINDFTINVGSYVRCEPCCCLRLIK